MIYGKPFKLRVAIRKSTYRNRQGFLIMSNRGVFGQQVFTETRESAEKIKQKIRDDKEITSDDFKGEKDNGYF